MADPRTFLSEKCYLFNDGVLNLNNPSPELISAILDKFEPNLYSEFSGPGRRILDESDTTYESPISEIFCTGLCKISKKSPQGGYVVGELSHHTSSYNVDVLRVDLSLVL